MSPEYQQLSALMASLMEELLDIKRLMPELGEFTERVEALEVEVKELASRKLDVPSMRGQVYYRDVNNHLWVADSSCANRPYPTGFDEPYLIRHGARPITLAGAVKLGWPACDE